MFSLSVANELFEKERLMSNKRWNKYIRRIPARSVINNIWMTKDYLLLTKKDGREVSSTAVMKLNFVDSKMYFLLHTFEDIMIFTSLIEPMYGALFPLKRNRLSLSIRSTKVLTISYDWSANSTTFVRLTKYRTKYQTSKKKTKISLFSANCWNTTLQI